MTSYPDKATDGVIVEHYCCIPGCKKWGGLGFARVKHGPIQWWCSEHYPHKELSVG